MPPKKEKKKKDKEADSDLTEEQKLYKELRKFVRRENHAKALNVCTQLRKKLPNDDEPVRCHCVCLLNNDKFQQAYDVAHKALGPAGSSRDPASFLLLERAYCLYRLQKLTQALKLLNTAPAKEKQPELLHLEAQIRYRQGDYTGAIEVYEKVLPHEDDPTEALANMCAAHFAAGQGGQGLEAVPEDFAGAEKSHELAYNMGCCAADAGRMDEAEERLQAAEKLARSGLAADGWEPQEVEQEVAVILVQLAFVVQLAGDTVRAGKIYKSVLKSKPEDTAVLAAASNNLAAMRGERDLFNSTKLIAKAAQAKKLPPAAAEVVDFNRVLLLLYAGKYAECRAGADELRGRYKSKASQARCSVLLAALLLREGKRAECEAQLKALPNDVEAQLALAHVQLVGGRRAEAARVLRAVKQLQHSPATVATVVAIYDAAGMDAEVKQVFDEAVRSTQGGGEGAAEMQQAAARFMLARGMHAAAAQAFESVVEGGGLDGASRLEATANIVLALSSCGVDDADEARLERWSARLPEVGAADTLDAEALESSAPLRALSRRLAQPAKATVQDKKKAPNPQRVAKKRAKRRELHVAKLQEQLKDGPPGAKLKAPDPERWIPRRERASFLKKQRRGKFGSAAQGTGHAGEKDALKLDARLRKEMEAQNPQEQKVKGVLNTTKSTMSRAKGKKKGRRK
eukprot:g1956.t1